jgi:hypothetical protein
MEKIQTNKDEQIGKLIDQLGDADPHERLKARRQLMSVGKSALPAIISALFNTDENIRWQAAKLLSELRDPTTAPSLVKVLADDDHFGVRWLAAEALINMRLNGLKPVVQSLIRRPESIWLRQGVHHVLHSLHDRGLTGSALDDVLCALEGRVPSLEIPVAAEKALEDLRMLKSEGQ